jgi:hypothetical protein
MNAFFRHMAVRVWGTILFGSLICMTLLPAWQGVLGLATIYLPVVVAFTLCFMALGWMMNRIGLAQVRRQVSEAAVWERAGMSAEAENAFERAKAVYDGFWLSPMQRRRCADWLSKRLARFYLAQAALGRKDHAMVLSYLGGHPDDDTVALAWLEAALRRERHSRQEQEIAARVGDALEANDQVQRLLMQFYLSDRRVDFEALQTYRRVWHQRGALPESLILSLAQVLSKESIINDWALKVYLRGYSLGDPHCLEGIAAGERLLSINTDNRHDLSAAREILSVLNEEQRRKLIRPFESQVAAQEKPKKSKPAPKIIAKAEFDAPGPSNEEKFELGQWSEEDDGAEVPAPVKPRNEKALLLAKSVWGQSKAMMSAIWRYCLVLTRMGWRGLVWAFGALLKPLLKNGINTWRQSASLRRGTAYAAAGIVILALAIAGWRSMGGVPEPIEPAIAPVAETTPAPVTDPFTIQVAAYLKPEDAQRLVDRLKQEQIDAFWTKAASANRTWYQVKVSHFPTRDDARKYGQQLRSRGLIDDFYVSNYSR